MVALLVIMIILVIILNSEDGKKAKNKKPSPGKRTVQTPFVPSAPSHFLNTTTGMEHLTPLSTLRKIYPAINNLGEFNNFNHNVINQFEQEDVPPLMMMPRTNLYSPTNSQRMNNLNNDFDNYLVRPFGEDVHNNFLRDTQRTNLYFPTINVVENEKRKEKTSNFPKYVE